MMDKPERQRLKTLANEAIIATFGNDNREQRLAEGLERAIDELEYIADECDHCKKCPTHGSYDDDAIDVDVNELLRIHGELKKQVQSFKNLHVKFAGAVAESDVDDLIEELASQIEETEGYVDEIEAEVSP